MHLNKYNFLLGDLRLQVISVEEGDFFFDFIRYITDWIKREKCAPETYHLVSFDYQLFFMKKTWVDTIPGKDPDADNRFLVLLLLIDEHL